MRPPTPTPSVGTAGTVVVLITVVVAQAAVERVRQAQAFVIRFSSQVGGMQSGRAISLPSSWSSRGLVGTSAIPMPLRRSLNPRLTRPGADEAPSASTVRLEGPGKTSVGNAPLIALVKQLSVSVEMRVVVANSV